MKKIIAILLVVLMVITLFAGCSARATTAETENLPVINVGETVPDETEASTEAETTTEKPTETTTGETTTEKVTETTTKADSTTKKSETTSKKSETTTKTETTTRGETTTKKSSSSSSATTTKPSTTKPAETTKPAPSTTSHTHNWTAHYAEKEVLVKEAWDEPDHWVDKYHTHVSGRECKTCGMKFGFTCPVCGYFYAYEEDGTKPYGDDTNGSPTGNSAGYDAGKHAAQMGHTLKNVNEAIAWIDLGYWEKGEHHDAEYKTEKYIDYYTCPCGAKKES